MKNVTITMDEDTLRAARVEAARRGVSLSRFVGELVGRAVARPSQSETLERILARGFPASTGGPLPTREELYAERIDKLVRRHERPDLHAGSVGFGEAEQSDIVDAGPLRTAIDRSEPPESE